MAAASATSSAGADTITLRNGRVIEADRAWFEGAQVRYEKNGGTFGLPRDLVARVDTRGPISPDDPDLVRAREALAAGNPTEAARVLRQALARAPDSVPTLQALTEAYLALRDPHAAREAADRAVRRDESDPRSRALLGDALFAIGDSAGAAREYRRSLAQRPDDADVQRKLADAAAAAAATGVAAAPAAGPGGAQFRLRYDGAGFNEPLGVAILKALDAAWIEHARRLGFRPDEPITVVLQTEAAFQDGRTPDWAAGLNDGTIRVPVGGVDRLGPRLEAVLRHELAHSFIAARTGGNCPTWLQEGVSQWLEGGDPAREDAALAPAARARSLHALLTLEAPFQSLPPAEVSRAYAKSLSAVAHILRRSGEAGVVRLLAALGDGLPSEEALPVALALSYPEFQASWEAHLSGLPGPASR